jgi:hypothetical protein
MWAIDNNKLSVRTQPGGTVIATGTFNPSIGLLEMDAIVSLPPTDWNAHPLPVDKSAMPLPWKEGGGLECALPTLVVAR